jgi:hypothetical protein
MYFRQQKRVIQLAIVIAACGTLVRGMHATYRIHDYGAFLMTTVLAVFGMGVSMRQIDKAK